MAVMKADKAGMSYVVPMTDMAPKLLGLDGTHIAMKFALLGSGTANALTPSVLFMSGSHTGGGANGALRSVNFDPAQAAAGFTATHGGHDGPRGSVRPPPLPELPRQQPG